MFALTPRRVNNKPMDNFFSDFDSLLEPWTNGWSSGINMSSNDQQYLVSVDVPGFSKDDLEISVEDGAIRIEGRKDTGNSVRQIQRSFSLPKDIDIDKTQASVEHGVLTLALPKTAETQKKLISIS